VTDAADKRELFYLIGQQIAWLELLRLAMDKLGYDGTVGAAERWVLEREAAVATLRLLCERYGDNDWTPDVHLSDILDKHLRRHLERIEVAISVQRPHD